MTFKELYEKEGIEGLQSKVQDWVSKKVDDEVIVVTLEPDEEMVQFVFSFPNDEDKYVNESVYFDDEIEGDDCIQGLMTRIAESLWENFSDLADFFDAHQTNFVEKINH